MFLINKCYFFILAKRSDHKLQKKSFPFTVTIVGAAFPLNSQL